MRAFALLLVVALAAPAWAEPPADAPVRVRAGSVVPWDGVLDTSDGYTGLVRERERLAAQVRVYEARPSVPVAVVLVVVTAVVSAAAAAGVTYAVTRPPPK